MRERKKRSLNTFACCLLRCSFVRPYIIVLPRFSCVAHETALIIARESGHDVVWFAEIGVTACGYSSDGSVRLLCPVGETGSARSGYNSRDAHRRSVTRSAANRIKTTRKGPRSSRHACVHVCTLRPIILRNTRTHAYRAPIGCYARSIVLQVSQQITRASSCNLARVTYTRTYTRVCVNAAWFT